MSEPRKTPPTRVTGRLDGSLAGRIEYLNRPSRERACQAGARPRLRGGPPGGEVGARRPDRYGLRRLGRRAGRSFRAIQGGSCSSVGSKHPGWSRGGRIQLGRGLLARRPKAALRRFPSAITGGRQPGVLRLLGSRECFLGSVAEGGAELEIRDVGDVAAVLVAPEDVGLVVAHESFPM